MTHHLERLKGAERELRTLSDNMPNLDLSLDHRLRVFFPQLPDDSCVDYLYVSYEAPAEPGQSPVIISRSISSLIDECYLTHQIPTFVQGATNVYTYAYSLDTQDLATGITLAGLEKYLDFVIKNLDLCVKDALTEFWRTPNSDFRGATPNDWLSTYSRNLILSEAELRHEDNTLSSPAKEAITQMLSPSEGSPAPVASPYGFYTLALKAQPQVRRVAFNGVFIITDKSLLTPHLDQDDTARTLVLFTPSSGLEVFGSFKALSQELSARLKDAPQRQTLLSYMLAEDQGRALELDQLEYLPVTEDFNTFYSAQLINKQQRDMAYDWIYARSHRDDFTVEQLSERVDACLLASGVLKPELILSARYTRLLESQLPTWLKAASDDDKTQWRLAVERLTLERRASQVPDGRLLAESGHRNTLLGYARIQLKHAIKKDHGLDIDPDSVYIATTEALQSGPVINPLSGSGFAAGASINTTGPTITYRTTRRSLCELALANVGSWDVTFALTAQVTDANGNRHPVLTRAYLKALVRRLDIGQNYKSLLNTLLVNSAQARWRKERYVAVSDAQLKLDLIEARLAGTLAAEHVAWIEAALDHPIEKNRPKVNGADIKVHLLMLRYKPLPGLLVFSSTGSTRLICYLPGAPDQRWFINVSSRNDLGRVLSLAYLRNYVLRRVTNAQQAYITPLLDERLTDKNVQLQLIPHHMLQASYDTEALHAIRDADEQSTSTWESNLNTAKETALNIIDVVSFVLPVKVLLPVALSRFIYTLLQGVDALQREEKHEAMLHFLQSITHLTDGASDFAGSAVFGAAIRQRIKLPAAALSPGAASNRPRADLTLRRSEQLGAGIYESKPTGNGQPDHYVKDSNDHLYRSHYDNLDDVWRVKDERRPDALYATPVRETSAGLWDVDITSPLLGQKTGIERLIESAHVSDIDLSRHTPDTDGIYSLNNKRYINQDGNVFEVYSGWLGRNWYLQVPGSSGAGGAYKVRFESGLWKIKHRLASGTKRWEPLLRDSTQIPEQVPGITYSAYDVPAEHKANVQDLIKHQPGLLDPNWIVADPNITRTGQYFATFRQKLLTDARAFFKTAVIRSRNTRPEIPVNTSPKELLKRLHEESPGIVIGEKHSEQGGKKILIDEMGDLAKNKVKALYLEHLQTDAHQALLDDFFKTGKMPIILDEFLKAQDAGHQMLTSSTYTYSKLVREARRHGIQIRALDCMASYNTKGLRGENKHLIRYEIFSYFASKIIRAHQDSIGGGKWIALTGNTHINTFQGVPGLAELEGVIGLRISDSAPGTSHGVRQNTRVVVAPEGTQPHATLLNADYWLQIDIPGTPPKAQAMTPAHTSQRLNQPGMFRLENAAEGRVHLVHRASNDEIVRTPVQSDPSGQFFIERASWGPIHAKRYDHLKDLISDLKNQGMTQMM